MAEQDDPRIGEDARDDATAAAVVSETDRPGLSGGGGLGGASAADRSGPGGPGIVPDSSTGAGCPSPEGSPDVIGHEAALRAGGDAPEGEPASR